MAESIGERLKQARESRNLSFDQVAEATRIRPYYIQALEKDDYSAVPSAAQARGFLRIYAGYLGLNPDELISSVKPVEPPPAPAAAVSPQTAPAPVQPAAATQAVGKPHSGLLSGLRGLFARGPAEQTPAAPGEPEKPPAQPVPEIPITNKEEPLPAEAAAAAVEPPAVTVSPRKTAVSRSTKSRPAAKDKTTPVSSRAKKSAARPKASPDGAGSAEPVIEKKKITS